MRSTVSSTGSPSTKDRTTGKNHFNNETFRKGLGISEEDFLALKTDIRALIDEELDLSLSFGDQPDNRLQLEIMVVTKYPEIFAHDKEKKTRLVSSFAEKRFGWLRHSKNKRLLKKEADAPRVLPPAIRPDLPPSPSSESGSMTLWSPAPPRVTLNTLTPSCSTPIAPEATNQESELSSPSPLDSTLASDTSRDRSSLLGTPDPSAIALDEIIVQQRQHTSTDVLSPPALQHVQTLSIVKYYAGSSSREIEGIRFFLRSCTPPMEYFVERFLNYGCHSLRLLQAAKSWPPDIVDSFLRDLPARNGREMTPMEVLILRMHLSSFPFDDNLKHA